MGYPRAQLRALVIICIALEPLSSSHGAGRNCARHCTNRKERPPTKTESKNHHVSQAREQLALPLYAVPVESGKNSAEEPPYNAPDATFRSLFKEHPAIDRLICQSEIKQPSDRVTVTIN